MKNSLVLYHGECPDGFCAAFAAWLVLGTTADYVPCYYGRELPDVTGKEVYILDFSFSWKDMLTLDSQASTITLLDHHKTAMERIGSFKCTCGSVKFDLTKSGARLAWEHFHPGTPIPLLVAYVEDRDLWKWSMPNCAAYLAALDSTGYAFERWEAVLQQTELEHTAFIKTGAALDSAFKARCAALIEKRESINFHGVQGFMVKAPLIFRSEVGCQLAKLSGSFGLVWELDDKSEFVQVSLRSFAPFDVSEMASKFGGGGHPQASGFILNADEFFKLFPQ